MQDAKSSVWILIMQLQTCYYKATKNSSWKVGVACLGSGFGISDVKYILDEEGDKLKDCWDYHLFEVYPGLSKGYGFSLIDTGLFEVPDKLTKTFKVAG